MPPSEVNQGTGPELRPTRREVLRVAAAAGMSVLVPAAPGSQDQATSQPTSAPTAFRPWWMEAFPHRSRVVDIRSDEVLRDSIVDETALERLLDRGIRALTGARTGAEAWRAVLGRSRRIVLKFNSVGAAVIGTTPAMARVLVGALGAAGYDPSGLTLVEVPEYLHADLGTRRAAEGWGAAISVGGRMEPVVNYWYGADAVINVPFLKSHQIAGMSASMKNISHALIRHPGLFHDDGCSPYVGQVVGNKEVSSRIKLNVVNALRVVVKNGPDAAPDDLFAYAGLLLGYDPVAGDTLGLGLLTSERTQAGLKKRLDVRYIRSAAQLGVGRTEASGLDQVLIGGGG